MTLTVRIEVPASNGPYEALITQVGRPDTILVPGESVDITIWHGSHGPAVSEVPAGTKAARNADAVKFHPAPGDDKPSEPDFLAGKSACDLSGEKGCDSCQ